MQKYLVTLEIEVHDPDELADHVAAEMSKIGKSDYANKRESSPGDKTSEDLQYLFGAFYDCPGAFVELINVAPKD